ncbi:MAG TPA: TlpA disulfide reductase family protein [Woeseiaceae bacterium]|nr:TlpA disulfide reductase family protein [Woeseiaceae bacterium]
MIKNTLSALLISLFLIACDQLPTNDDNNSIPKELDQSVSTEKQILRDFELIGLDGSIHQSSQWNNKSKLINFWATWCAPCRREIPLLNKTQNNYSDMPIQIIGIAVDLFDDVISYSKETEFNYPILIGEEDAIAIAEDSGVDFIGLPFTMVVTKDNEILKTHIGEIKKHHIEIITQVMQDIRSGKITTSQAKKQLGKI